MEPFRSNAALGTAAAPDREEAHWQAHLQLEFATDRETTRLVDCRHSGPLRVQKPLYPEGAQICHAVVLHPPGGVVGGDQLTLHARVGAGAHAVLTTPGAAKWYRANGKTSRQTLHFDAADGACLEWLPQESIFFDSADVALTQTVDLAGTATYIGAEICCFGRTAQGETFSSGNLAQRIQLRRDGQLIWWEQGSLGGGSAAMHSPLGLAGNSVCATLLAAGKPVPAALLEKIRQDVEVLAGGRGEFGISQRKSLLVARYLGTSSEFARQITLCVWQHLRPALTGWPAEVPRIWNT